MASSGERDVILVEILELKAPFEEVAGQLRHLAGRVEREGVPGLRSMVFYTAPERRELAAVIRFADAAQMNAYTDSRRGANSQCSRPSFDSRMRIHGPISADVEAWIRQFEGQIRKYEDYVAGFAR